MFKSQASIHFLVLFLMVLLGIASREWLVSWPNFKPVAAIGLFLGFYFRSWWLGGLAILCVMLVSDALIGFYSLPLMISVYGSLALCGFLGSRLSHSFGRSNSIRGRFISLLTSSMMAAFIFYLTTNTAAWWFGSSYPRNHLGWFQCLSAGLPFFRNTVIGNLFFGFAIFEGYFATIRIANALTNEFQWARS